jgi:hypothetical protein
MAMGIALQLLFTGLGIGSIYASLNGLKDQIETTGRSRPGRRNGVSQTADTS